MTEKMLEVESIDLTKYVLGLFRPGQTYPIGPDCPWSKENEGQTSKFKFGFRNADAAKKGLTQWKNWCRDQGPRKVGNDYKELLARARRVYQEDTERKELELMRAADVTQEGPWLVFSFNHPAAASVLQGFWLAFNADYIDERNLKIRQATKRFNHAQRDLSRGTSSPCPCCGR